jgi:MATE family multidrug resistance protein
MSNAANALPAGRAGLRTLLALAWPVVLARSSQSVVGICDAAMSAPLGETALAAATSGAINAFAFMVLPMGTVFIVQSFAAQLYGAGDLPAARRYAWYGLLLAALTMVGAVAVTAAVGPVMGRFAYEPRVHALMTDYIVIRLWSIGAVVGTEALGNWFAGLGNTRVQMRASVVTMVTNVALNWVLIYGKLGAPALGVEGAALASTLASWIGFAVVAVAFRAREREIERQAAAAGPRPALGLRAHEFLRMLRFGLPNGLNWFMEFAAFLLFINAVVAGLGTTVIAAFNVILQINSISFMPAFGLASAGAILVGQAIGGGMAGEVGRVVRRTLAVALVWQVGVGFVYFTLPGPLMRIFAPPGGVAGDWMRIGALMLAISGAWQAFDAIGITLGEALRAAGDTAWCMWARLAIAWLVFVPGAYLLVTVRGGGPPAVMWCVVFYLACLAAALGWRFRSGAWRRIHLIEEERRGV